MDLEKSIAFIKQNARTLDLEKYKCRFENGSQIEFLEALRKYQNTDGGFGHGIEPDFLNPNSSPIATWYATQYIRSVYPVKTKNDVIEGILSYLNSGLSFIDGMWLNTISSNNDYPHAIWWAYNDINPSLNPTASLAAFIIDYADKDSEVYNKALNIVKHCFRLYMEKENSEIDMHITSCMIRMYETLHNNKIYNLFNFLDFKEKIINDVKLKIKVGKEQSITDYIARASRFVKNEKSFLYPYLKTEIKEELNYISKIQLADGSFNPTWQWHNNFKKEEIQSLHYWKSIECINNIIFYSNFSSLIK